MIRELQKEYKKTKELIEEQYEAILESKQDQIGEQLEERKYLRQKILELTNFNITVHTIDDDSTNNQ